MTSQVPNKVDVLVIGAGTIDLTVAVSLLSQAGANGARRPLTDGP